MYACTRDWGMGRDITSESTRTVVSAATWTLFALEGGSTGPAMASDVGLALV